MPYNGNIGCEVSTSEIQKKNHINKKLDRFLNKSDCKWTKYKVHVKKYCNMKILSVLQKYFTTMKFLLNRFIFRQKLSLILYH